jgi:hypothetical protein
MREKNARIIINVFRYMKFIEAYCRSIPGLRIRGDVSLVGGVATGIHEITSTRIIRTVRVFSQLSQMLS